MTVATYREFPEPTKLADRMALFKAGQITWPEPQVRKWCNTCVKFSTEGVKTAGKGRCVLVRAHHRADGRVFDGGEAIACPYYVEGTP